jgi:hypothetical protein
MYNIYIYFQPATHSSQAAYLPRTRIRGCTEMDCQNHRILDSFLGNDEENHNRR